MKQADEHPTPRVDMESMLFSIARALRDALDDVNEAQHWAEQRKRNPYDKDAERAVQRLLQSVEGNLMDTVVGIRLVKKLSVDHSSDNHHGD